MSATTLQISVALWVVQSEWDGLWWGQLAQELALKPKSPIRSPDDQEFTYISLLFLPTVKASDLILQAGLKIVGISVFSVFPSHKTLYIPKLEIDRNPPS